MEPFEITNTGLVLNDGITKDDCLRLEQILKHRHSSTKWAIGDYLLNVPKVYGRTYKTLSEVLDWDEKKLADIKSIAKAWAVADRTEKPFSYHKVLASVKDMEKRRELITSEFKYADLEKAVRNLKDEQEKKQEEERKEKREAKQKAREEAEKKFEEEHGDSEEKEPKWQAVFYDPPTDDDEWRDIQNEYNSHIRDELSTEGMLFAWTTPALFEQGTRPPSPWDFRYRYSFILVSGESYFPLCVLTTKNDTTIPEKLVFSKNKTKEQVQAWVIENMLGDLLPEQILNVTPDNFMDWKKEEAECEV